MSERKSINKYYPPDFDPSKVARRQKGGPKKLQTVRLMAPFSMRCTTCGEFIYKGKKFNARKQETGDDYHGIKLIRFYIRCPRCAGEIAFRTDPQMSDYKTESGAVRNLEPWRDRAQEDETMEQRLDRLEREEAEFKQKQEREKKFGSATVALMDAQKSNPGQSESGDLMENLETRMNEAKREMEIEQELEDLRSRNAKVDRASGADLIDSIRARLQESPSTASHDKEDSEAARKAFDHTTTGERIKRAAPPPPRPKFATSSSSGLAKITKPTKRVNSLGVSKSTVKRKPLV